MHAIAKLSRIGGCLCLDFVNTAAYVQSTVLNEHLKTYRDVLAWGQASSLLAADAVRQLQSLDTDGVALDRLLGLRRRLHRLLDPGLRRDNLRADGDVAELASDLRRDLIAGRPLLPAGAPMHWDVAFTANPTWATVPIAVSALALLQSPDLEHVRTCEGEGCGWLFLDRTPGKARRWCAMEPCGNRIKARAHYQRRKAGLRAGVPGGRP